MADIVPPDIMTAERLAVSRSWGLASARAYDTEKPKERDFAAEELAALGLTSAQAVAPVQVVIAPPKIVGQTVTGRDWIILQLPDGRIRGERKTETEARADARTLAAAESGEFGVFQPRGISRPQTTVTDELL